jgi:CheY-like chemotaxis protein
VKLLGGEIKVDSQKDFGSKFYFMLDVDVLGSAASKVTKYNGTQCLIISNNKAYASQLNTECNQLGLSTTIRENSDELESQALNYDVIIYCQHSLVLTHNDINRINALSQKPGLVICRKHGDEKADFNHTIDGLVIYPLLGNRFCNAINQALKSNKNKHEAVLPLDCPDDVPMSTQEENAETKTILIVEDNLVNQKVASLLLKKEGFNVDLANDGQEAVNMVTAKTTVYSLILMDCMMPVMDGFAATEAIRAWEQEQMVARLPIIALTASVFVEDIDKCYQSGMDDYVAKPFKKELMLEKLEAYT